MDALLVQMITVYGPMFLVLLWFMFRMERRLAALERSNSLLAQSIALSIRESGSASDYGKSEADRIYQRAGKNLSDHDKPNGFLG